MNANKEGQGTLIWLVCWVADMLRTFRVNFSDIFRYLPSQWQGGMNRLILHGDDVNVGGWWCQRGLMMMGGWWYCIVFLISHFLAANAMHWLSALFRRPFLVEEKVSYFPFVEKHFLFLAQALNCWIPAEKEEFSISYLCVQCILCVFVPDCIRKNASSQCLYEGVFGFWCDILGLMS